MPQDPPPRTPRPPAEERRAPAQRAPLAGRLRPRFAALGLVGGLMVCLPLVQLLQYQAAELEWTTAQRAALDPAADAVAVQRSLLAHGDAAGQVLRGRTQAEPQRRSRQAEVDNRLGRLAQSLDEGHWDSALNEQRLLAQDWQALAEQVARRRISAEASDEGHRLRVEQVLQVLDLLALALAPRPDTALAEAGAARRAWQPAPGTAAAAALGSTLALPRLAGQWAELSPGSDAAARRAAQQALQQHLRVLRAAGASRQDGVLAGATERADARSARWLEHLARLHAGGSAPAHGDAAAPGLPTATAAAAADAPTDVQPLRTAALQALFELQAAAGGHSRQALDARLQAVHLQRAGTLAALAALLAVALWAARSRTPAGERAQPLAPATTQPPLHSLPPRPESAPVAEHLLQRLQQAPGARRRGHPAPPRDAQPSLPPQD
jgi:hypothetical protein